MIKAKILPPKAKNYRQKYFATWDIETLEKDRNFESEIGQDFEITEKLD